MVKCKAVSQTKGDNILEDGRQERQIKVHLDMDSLL